MVGFPYRVWQPYLSFSSFQVMKVDNCGCHLSLHPTKPLPPFRFSITFKGHLPQLELTSPFPLARYTQMKDQINTISESTSFLLSWSFYINPIPVMVETKSFIDLSSYLATRVSQPSYLPHRFDLYCLLVIELQ